MDLEIIKLMLGNTPVVAAVIFVAIKGSIFLTKLTMTLDQHIKDDHDKFKSIFKALEK